MRIFNILDFFSEAMIFLSYVSTSVSYSPQSPSEAIQEGIKVSLFS